MCVYVCACVSVCVSASVCVLVRMYLCVLARVCQNSGENTELYDLSNLNCSETSIGPLDCPDLSLVSSIDWPLHSRANNK